MQSYRLPPGHCIELPGCTLTPDTLTLPFPLRLSEAHQLLMLATVERMRTGIPKRRTPPARHVPSVGQPALSSRGFGSRPPEQRRAIAQQGGRQLQALGLAHRFTSEEARRAGQQGGLVTSSDREHMAQLGRKGAASRLARLATSTSTRSTPTSPSVAMSPSPLQSPSVLRPDTDGPP